MHFDQSRDATLNKQQIQDSACRNSRHLLQERFNAAIISTGPAKISTIFSKKGSTPLLFPPTPFFHAIAAATPRFCRILRSPKRQSHRSCHLRLLSERNVETIRRNVNKNVPSDHIVEAARKNGNSNASFEHLSMVPNFCLTLQLFISKEDPNIMSLLQTP